MRVGKTVLALCILFGACGVVPAAEAAKPDRHRSTAHATTASKALRTTGGRAQAGRRNLHRVSYAPGISCVPYARQATGMQISGNGWQWWQNAAGSYARGSQPEPGSIFAFRSSGGMRMGHVAVVSQVVSPRHILVDHANWAGPGLRKGQVMTGAHVVDVSPNNDWTQVRLQVGRDAETFGRTYPTYGFIYNRPDTGSYYAAGQNQYEQVAEAAEAPRAPVRRRAQTHRR